MERKTKYSAPYSIMFCFHLVDTGSGYDCNPTTEKNQEQYCLCAQGKRISRIESTHMDNWFEDNNEDRTWKLTCSEIKIPDSDKEFDAAREKYRSGYRSKAQH